MNSKDPDEDISPIASSTSASSLSPQTPTQNPHGEDQLLSDYLDRIESLWVRLQKRSASDSLPVDHVALFLAEVEHLFPVVLSAAYRVDTATQEFTFERCAPPALQDDIQEEAQRQITAGHFAMALWHRQPTLRASLGLHRYHPRVRTIVLVPLVTRQEAYGMMLVAIERAAQDIALHELQLLSIQAGQTALALESAQHATVLQQQQKVILEYLEREAPPRPAEPTPPAPPVSESPKVAVSAADTQQPLRPTFRPPEPAPPTRPVSASQRAGVGTARAQLLSKLSQISSRAAFLSLLIAVVVILFFVVWQRSEHFFLLQRTKEPPSSEEQIASSQPQPEPAVPSPPSEESTRVPVQPAAESPQPPPSPSPPEAPPSPPPQPEQLATKPPHQLRIYATEETWVRATIDGERTKDVLLQPGQQVEWSAQQGFVLIVGNAGGVQLTLNGEELPRLGASGQVVRNLRLPPPEQEGAKGEKDKGGKGQEEGRMSRFQRLATSVTLTLRLPRAT